MIDSRLIESLICFYFPYTQGIYKKIQKEQIKQNKKKQLDKYIPFSTTGTCIFKVAAPEVHFVLH